MKKLLLLLILLSASLPGFSRIVDDEKGFALGVGFGHWHESSTFPTPVGRYHWHMNHFLWSTRVGYRITPDYEAGAFIRQDYHDGDLNLSWLGVYGEFGFKHKGPFRIFLDGDIGCIFASDMGTDIDFVPKDYYWEIGVRPGVAYKLKSLPIEFKLRYLFIGFNDYHYDVENARLRKGDWIIDAGLRSLEIGAAVTF
ncbi:MAG: hypothetical protein HDS15_05830 [Bacteroides sp.]|nr:hypothetical protein [Bacteroides sp.]